MPNLHLLPAANGDCLLLQWEYKNKSHQILIDGGTPGSYPTGLRPVLKDLHDGHQNLDLVVLTHIDNDHIGGILKMVLDLEKGYFRQDFVKEWWYNSRAILAKEVMNTNASFPGIALPKDHSDDDTQVSFKQGNTLEKFLDEGQNHFQQLIHLGLKPLTIGGATITFLSPDLDTLKKLSKNWETYIEKEIKKNVGHATRDYLQSIEDLAKQKYFKDSSVFNASSIAFLFEIDDLAILFLGDAVPETYVPAIEALCQFRKVSSLKLDLVKISHHGSRFNFNEKLLESINCTHFATSTDGEKHAHPHKTTFAKIIKSEFRNKNKKLHFYFNYSSDPIKEIFKKEKENNQTQEYKFEDHTPEGDTQGYLINFPL